MAIDPAKIRAVFPSWPSDLDVAKSETSWALMAQEFYCAATVLQNEMSAVKQRMHSGEPLEMTESILQRIHLLKPALFCMAFALELAAKAATVRKCQGAGIEHDKRLPFAGHGVTKLCEQLPELALSETDRNCIARAEEIIVNGKYPTDIKPREDKSSSETPNLDTFVNAAVPIYSRLMALACDAQPAAPGDAPQAARLELSRWAANRRLRMSINEQAPAKSTRELYIEATCEVVWGLLADINNWPRWNPAVSRARLDGPFAPGSIFRWKSGGSSLVSRIQDVERPTRLVWTGETFGVAAVHLWELKAVGPGVLVKTSESFDGWLVRLFRSPFQRILEKALEDALRSLKTAAEKLGVKRQLARRGVT